jgi:site-specific DNA-adenine methylase
LNPPFYGVNNKERSVKLNSERPPRIDYPGAKGKLAPILVSMMPSQGHTYVEPFVGRGNVFFAAASTLNFEEWTINDIATAPFFKAIIEKGKHIKVPERTRPEYLKQKQLFQCGDPRAILLEPYLTYSGGGYKKGGFGNKRGVSAREYANRLRRCAELLSASRAKITALDWKELKLTTLSESDFVFLDPPYYGADVRAYSSKEFDFFGMVDVLSKAKFKWMLTEYEQEFYLKAFGKPCYTENVQLACDGGRGRRRRIECVWKNF